MTPFAFEFAGAALLADPMGALVWPDAGTVVVADLHLEKGSGYARHGTFLPPYDSRATLERLAAVIETHGAQRVICLGDSFHDGEAAGRLGPAERKTLRALASRCDWIWICGNHDPAPPEGVGGSAAEEVAIGPLLFRHAALSDAGAGEISGHYHPKASVRVRGRRLSGRCFIADQRRLILPAFGAYTGGLDVRSDAIGRLFPSRYRVHILGRNRVVSIPDAALA